MTGAGLYVFAVAGADTTAQRLRQLLQAGGGACSTAPLEIFETPAASLEALKEYSADTVIVLAHVPGLDGMWTKWLQEVKNLAHVVPVIITDDSSMATAAAEQGITTVVPDMGIGPAMLDAFIQTGLYVQGIKQRQRHLQQLYDMAEQRFRDMADQFSDWLWEVDANLSLTFSSSRKRPAQEATKGTPFVNCFLPEEKMRIEDDFAELFRNPSSFHDRDYWTADAYGTRFCWSVSGTPVKDSGGAVVGYRGIARDVSPMKTTTDQLYYYVNNDPLTGITNRARFYEELTRTVRVAKREKRTGALVVLDLDRFGYINQAHGHAVGDKLLVHVAQVLKDSIRTGDMVARLDGDQFGLLLRDLQPQDVPARLEHLQNTLVARPLQTENGPITLTLSGGSATYPQDGGEADSLLAHATDALARAKTLGPNRMEMYDSKTKPVIGRHLEWVEMLTRALEDPEGNLAIYYQPIVPISGRLEGEYYEALIRLIDEEGEPVPAVQFIPTAEEFGLVAKLDRAVVTRAIKALEHYHGLERPIHVSVNLSAKTFEEDDLFEDIVKLLKRANLPDGSLIFEITETALLRDLPKVKAIIAKLKKAGAGFALDDCGVGYSSLNHIRHLDLDYIKIDGSFIRNLHNSPDDQSFVKALVDVARHKGIATVAEMVEHEAAVAVLHKLGIDFGQGFHFAPPSAEIPAGKPKAKSNGQSAAEAMA